MLTGGTVTGGNGSYTYLWESSTSPGGPFTPAAGINNSANYATGILTDTTTVLYFRRVVTSGGCSDTAAVVSITVDPLPAATAGGSETICSNGSATVSGATASGGTIAWSHNGSGTLTGGTTTTPTYTTVSADAGNTVLLTLTVTGSGSCAPSSDTALFTIFVQPVPSASVSGAVSSTICANGGTVTVLGASASNGTIQWTHDGQGTLANATTLFPAYTAVPDDAGDTVQLLLVVSDTTGCGLSDSATYTIVINPVGTGAFVDAGEDQTISLGNTAELDATGPAIVDWQWTPAADLSDPNIPDPVASPLVTTVYTLTATDASGCMATDSVTITVIEDFALIIANLITPNGDDKNDTWIIQNIENYPNTSVTIVNREGIIIYENGDYDNSWGGTYEGKIVPDGTYYYIVRFEDSDRIYKGGVTIIQN
jgi:gliding motility-associated-like protein